MGEAEPRSAQKKDDIPCLKFNGRRLQGSEDAKVALLEGMVTGLVNGRTLAKRAQEKVREAF